MPTFIDVGVVRVQEYIMRTAGADEGQLRKRRGASRMVAEETSADKFADLGCLPNDETYTAEGVAHLVVDEHTDTAPADLANGVLGQLSDALPNAYIEASWCEAADYLTARQILKDLRTDGWLTNGSASAGLVRGVPSVRDDPFAARCNGCGLGAAERGTTCLDCTRRDKAGSASPPSDGPASPEQKTMTAVGDFLAEASGKRREVLAVRDLNQLSRLPAGPLAKRNQLATIYADGNAVGALFEQLADGKEAIRVSDALDCAIRAAGVEALASVVDDCRPPVSATDSAYLPGVVTVLAADDALFTVPATLAWPIVRKLIHAFNRLIENSLQADKADKGLTLPTLTAGICFHHVKSSMEAAIGDAYSAMRLAKEGHPRRSAIGWADRVHPTEAPACVSWEWLVNSADLLGSIAQLPASQRAKWERDIAHAPKEGVAPEELRLFLAAEAQRLGLAALADAELSLADINHALAIARWWPTPNLLTEDG